jgi:hypothetical protein
LPARGTGPDAVAETKAVTAACGRMSVSAAEQPDARTTLPALKAAVVDVVLMLRHWKTAVSLPSTMSTSALSEEEAGAHRTKVASAGADRR